jgi:transcriptional regulator with XRE-family HTH domain
MSQTVTDSALAPARWMLEAGANGIPLTQTNALARSVVREAAERWPGWWNAELFGPPHREADLAVLNALHDGLRRLRLVRRRGRRLHTTARGRELAEQPARLLEEFAGDLGAGDPFTTAVADSVAAALRAHDALGHDDLVATALRRVSRAGWVGPEGDPPSDRGVSWEIGDVLRRGEAYGLFERRPDPGERRFLRAEGRGFEAPSSAWKSLRSASSGVVIALHYRRPRACPPGGFRTLLRGWRDSGLPVAPIIGRALLLCFPGVCRYTPLRKEIEMATAFAGEAAHIKEAGHLTVPDIARATGVNETTVRAWLREERSPSGTHAERLAELSSIVERLVQVMQATYVPVWMRKPIPLLDDDKALDVIAAGDYRRVSRVVAGLEASGSV